MAEPEAPAQGDNSFGFLTRKIGPLPVWAWAAIAVAGYYWYTHYGPGAKQGKNAGQVVQVERDQFETQPQYGGSRYKTNAEWQDAAINYLVGHSIPPDEASAAVWNYLHSKALNTQERKDVNLAIQGIGPPPKIPEPAQVEKPKPHPFQPARKEGPEREFLERKTGSEHPWAYLQKHHETIEIGPRGSKVIRRKR